MPQLDHITYPVYPEQLSVFFLMSAAARCVLAIQSQPFTAVVELCGSQVFISACLPPPPPPLASALQLEASLWEQAGEDGLALSEAVLSSISVLWGTLGQPSTGGAVPLTLWET